MDLLLEFGSRFSNLLADSEFLQTAFLISLGLLAFMLSLWLGHYIQQRFDPVKERIEVYTARSDIALTLGKQARTERLLERLGRGLTPSNQERQQTTATRLAQLGYRRPQDVRLFFGLKVVTAIGAPLLVFAVNAVAGVYDQTSAPLIILMALPLGFVLPDYLVARRLRKRQISLRRALPDALDMLVVCAEAGLGLNAAIQRVAMEIDIQHPILAEELKTTMLHMGAGMDNRTALQELANRTGIEEMRSLVSTLQQAMRYGTSISETLRVYSEEMRNKRLEAAQEQAAKVSIRMMIPVALCMLPAVLVIVMGPSLINLLKLMGSG